MLENKETEKLKGDSYFINEVAYLSSHLNTVTLQNIEVQTEDKQMFWKIHLYENVVKIIFCWQNRTKFEASLFHVFIVSVDLQSPMITYRKLSLHLKKKKKHNTLHCMFSFMCHIHN